MAKKCEYMERKLTQVSQKLEFEQRKAENHHQAEADKVSQLVRKEIMLPNLSQIKLNAQQGLQ